MKKISELFSLVGKNIIVTGGTSGIGRTVADYLAAAGGNIAIISTHKDKSKSVAEQIKNQFNVDTVGLDCDVSDEEAVIDMVESISSSIGTPNVLFNNAGINIWGGIIDLKYSDWKRVMDVNLNGTMLVARAFSKKLISENIGGSIINNASISASIVNLPQYQTAYNTSKAAVLHLTKSLAVELSKHNIRVNAISPGYVWTEMNQVIPEKIRKVWVNSTPFGRFAAPDELAGAVIYFASDASTYTSGSELIIDGCFTCL
jgi:sorbose reductase